MSRRVSATRSAAFGGIPAKLLLVIAVVVVICIGVLAYLVRAGSDDSASPKPGTPPPSSGPGLSLSAPPPAPAVLAADVDAPPVSVARLRRHVMPALSLPELGSRLAFTVAQLGRPAVHWSYGVPSAMPASTTKLLTTAAALSVLGPDHQFTTTVRRGATKNAVVLVGGGDPLLLDKKPTPQEAAEDYPRPASLEQLAEATAARLSAAGVHRVHLSYNASMFSGPAVNPHWPSTYVPENVVSPISALWVNEGREAPDLAQRSADPARAAAEAFRAELVKAGLPVVGDVEQQARPAARTPPIAAVRSAPLVQIVQHILEVSDNEGAEVLLRQVAVARGQTGSSVAGVAAVRATLTRLGLDVGGARLYDGSGLSRDDLLPVSLLLGVLETAAQPGHADLRGVLTGLPVAGFSGSLGDDFQDGASDGLGYVRAKTGTLTGVHGLAGLATTRSGQVLLFVVIADRVPVPEPPEAPADLDRIAATLTTCGC